MKVRKRLSEFGLNMQMKKQLHISHEPVLRTHPFKPLVTPATKKLLIGTLPPEDVPFYFSHSSNTRLWDILIALDSKSQIIRKGGNELSSNQKINILNNLKLGISDIIYQYERVNLFSTKDKDIDPKTYLDLLELASENEIDELLFVYQSAFTWFNHSLQKSSPVRLHNLKQKYVIGPQDQIKFNGQTIKCTLLPAPLNRGRKGETLDFKLLFYRKHILGY